MAKRKTKKIFQYNIIEKNLENSPLTSNEDLRTWVEYSSFSKNDTLLENSLRKSTHAIRFLSFLVEELIPYAKTNPQSTLKCLNYTKTS